MKKKFIVLLTCSCLALTFAACGADKKDATASSSASSGSADSVSVAETAAGENVTTAVGENTTGVIGGENATAVALDGAVGDNTTDISGEMSGSSVSAVEDASFEEEPDWEATAESTAAESTAESIPAIEIDNLATSDVEAYSVGDFAVGVPTGWTAVPSRDVFGETDEEGNYPIETSAVVIAKGTPADEYEARTNANVTINWYGDVAGMDSRGFYENVKELNITVGGVQCDAFSGESLGYTYDIIEYPAASGRYSISVLTAIDGEPTGISCEDHDVASIISSLP